GPRTAPAGRARAGEHAQVRRGRSALRVRGLLGRRGAGVPMAGRGSRAPRLGRGLHGGRAPRRRGRPTVTSPGVGGPAGKAGVNAVAAALRELWGLFVEDASLTLGILVCLVIAAFAFPALGLRAAWRGPLLFVLLALVLLENARRSA